MPIFRASCDARYSENGSVPALAYPSVPAFQSSSPFSFLSSALDVIVFLTQYRRYGAFRHVSRYGYKAVRWRYDGRKGGVPWKQLSI